MATQPKRAVDRMDDLFVRMLQRLEDGQLSKDERIEFTRELADLKKELAVGHLEHTAIDGVRNSLGADAGLAVDLSKASKSATSPSSELMARLASQASHESRYRVEAEIARGGMGAILRVFDANLRRTLAMKVALERSGSPGERPSKQRERIGRFLEEAQITGQLDHPGIVPVHDLGIDSHGQLFFTMRLVRGSDLGVIYDLARTRSEGWSTTRVLGVLLKACEALAYAHSKGVIHRDLKPANVMVGRFGEVYVMDWGLAKVVGGEDSHDLRVREPASRSVSMLASIRSEERAANPSTPLVTMDGTVLGTPAYMSPEQASGEVEVMDQRSDIYALGAMLYQLFAGHAPYQDQAERLDAHRLWLKILRSAPRPLAELAPQTPPELVAIVERAMARDANERYRDVLSLAEDLRSWLEGRVVRAYRTGPIVELRAWIKRNKSLAASIAAAVVMLVAGLVGTSVMYARSEHNADLATARASDAEASNRGARVQSYLGLIRAAGAAWRGGETRNLRRFLDDAPPEHRNWEWRFLDAQSDSSDMVVSSPSGAITTASFSLDGSRILAGFRDGTARVYDSHTAQELLALNGHGGSIRKAQFVGDGSRIVTVADGIRVWDARTAQNLVTAQTPADGATGNARPIECELSPDGTRAIAYLGATGLLLWDLTDGHELRRIRVDADSYSFGVSSNWKRVVCWGSNDRVSVFDLDTGAIVRTREFQRDEPIAGNALTPNGLRVVTTLRVGQSVVWDVDSGEDVSRLVGHSGYAWVCGFDATGAKVITSSVDKTTRTWDLATGGEVARSQCLCGRMSTTSDATFERILARRADAVVVWNLRTASEVAVLRGPTVDAPELSSDASRVLATSSDGSLRVWSLDHVGDRLVLPETVEPWYLGEPTQFGQLLRWDDGRKLRVCDLITGATLVEMDFCNNLYDVTRKLLPISAVLDNPRLAILSVLCDPTPDLSDVERDDVDECAYSPDNRRIAWTTRSGQLHIREISGGHDVSVSLPARAFSLTWSADGERIVLESESGLLVAQASDGTIAIAPSIAQQNVEAFAISGDGAWLAAGYGNEMSVISMRELREVARCRGHTEKIQTVRFDSDSTQLVTASSDGTARTWNCIDGKPVAVMVGHREWIADAAFNSDGSRVVTASTDGTARLWDARNGAELLGFDHEDYMTSARFTADDQAILAVSQWGRIHVWNSRPRRAREAERQDRERALAAARAWVEQLLEDEHDLAAVVRRLRDDSSHSDLERELAPVDLMTRLVSGYAQADELISRYALRHGRREHLARDLEREPGLHWIVRALAQNYINEWVDRPDPPEDNR